MRKNDVIAMAAVALLCTAAAVRAASPHSFSAGARYHVNHTTFLDLPYDDGDLSYGLAYEFHDQAAFWQLAVTWAPDVNGEPEADSVITPEINLIATDNAWLAGLGALSSYIEYTDQDTEWTDIYFQFLLGLKLPLGRLEIDIYTRYVFERWDELSEFDAADIEYSAWIALPF